MSVVEKGGERGKAQRGENKTNRSNERQTIGDIEKQRHAEMG